MKVLIDGAEIGSRRALHAYLQQALLLPDWYGRNLDALFDCLTDMGECSIIFRNLDDLEMLGDYSGALLAVFEEAEQINEDINLIYDLQDTEDIEE